MGVGFFLDAPVDSTTSEEELEDCMDVTGQIIVIGNLLVIKCTSFS